jgi:hypothetical protein
MKVFKSKNKNSLYFIYRLINPIFDPLKAFTGLTGYFWFIRDAFRYKSLQRKAKIFSSNLYPILNEKTPLTSFDSHYFYHPLWVFQHIYNKKPKHHIDVGSTYALSGYLSIITKVTFIDIRPIQTELKNLTIKNASVLDLPYRTNSVESLSCLHVAEHIGLGRYGDPIDPEGTKKACTELTRVLAKNGFLYFCLPIGKERLCFNAHRVHSPDTILKYFHGLKLMEFTVVNDEGKYIKNTNPYKYRDLNYGCGMFLFTKK